MTFSANVFAVLALFPAMTGNGGKAGTHHLSLSLCQGGSVVIPISPDGSGGPVSTACCAKGCQRRRNRREFDPGQ